MNFLEIISFLAVLNLCFVYISTSRFCLLPDAPNLGRLKWTGPNNKSYFNEGEVISCECDNKYIDMLQYKTCKRGEWSGDWNGMEFVCGIK